MEIICINCLFFFLILYTSAVQRCRTDCCVCSGFLYISAFLQVPFVHQTSPLSCHCLHASDKFSADMHWWTLVAKKTMQSCVSGHFHFTHVAPPGSSIAYVNGPSHFRTIYQPQSTLQYRQWNHAYCCPDDLFPNRECSFRSCTCIRLGKASTIIEQHKTKAINQNRMLSQC